MAKEIVLYNADKTEQLFPKTEASSVYDSATGFTVRDEISDLDQRVTKIEDNPVDLSGYYTKVEVDNKESAQNIYIQGLDERVSELEDGNVEIDLSDYYTKDEVDSKVPTVQSGGTGNSNNYIYSDYSISDTVHKTSVLTHVYVEPKPQADSVKLYTYKNYWGVGSGTTYGSYKSFPSATTELAGVMSGSDKAKLDSLEPVDLSEKQDTLVSGTNIKTINGESVLGSGDIELATDGLKIVKLTQEEYDALTEYDPDVLYAISDSTDSQSSLLAMIQALEARVAALEGN